MDLIMTQKNTRPPVSSSVLGILMVIVVELMFFGGLISAFILAQAGQVEWPPSDQPRLPFMLTFTNMLILLVSAYFMWAYIKDVKASKTSNKLFITIILGLVFFLIQGYEWVRILLFGIETSHSLFSSFFYTIIGLHGFHVFIGLLILSFAYFILNKTEKSYNVYNVALTIGIFWFFVVGLWPVLYYLIYWTR